MDKNYMTQDFQCRYNKNKLLTLNLFDAKILINSHAILHKSHLIT